MGFFDRFRPTPETGLHDQVEVLQESVRDLSLQLEDRGWSRIGVDEDALSREALVQAARDGRALAVAHPLVRRGLSLRTAYVHGQKGPQVVASTEADDEGQDVNAVVQAWWTSRENAGSLTGPEARARLERSLGTDGNVYIACFTNPNTGMVVNRTIPFEQITEIVTNPEDRMEVWFYKRVWTPQGAAQPITAYYPDLAYAPSRTPRTWEGHSVRWHEPIRHVKVNDLDGWQYGIGDLFSVASWARAYRDFLGDWAKYMKALSTFAWRATADGKRQQRAAKALQAAAGPGNTYVAQPGETLEAIPKTGATIDADSGRPLLAMIAAGLDVPVTMLSTDPGVTGARATAETLDEPMYLAMQARRDVWTAVYQDIAGYVIEQSVRAAQGVLRGEIVTDPWTRTDEAILDGATPVVSVDWPDLSTTSTKDMVDAIVSADGVGKLPPLTIVRLLLVALGVDDIDSVMEEVTDEETGAFRDPYATDGQALTQALRSGQDPPSVLSQFGRFQQSEG